MAACPAAGKGVKRATPAAGKAGFNGDGDGDLTAAAAGHMLK